MSEGQYQLGTTKDYRAQMPALFESCSYLTAAVFGPRRRRGTVGELFGRVLGKVIDLTEAGVQYDPTIAPPNRRCCNPGPEQVGASPKVVDRIVY